MEHVVDPWVLFGMAMIVAAVLSIAAFISTRRLEMIPTTRMQNTVELVAGSLNNFVIGIVGPKGEKYTPFIGTLFIYILAMNLLGPVFGIPAPTSNISITLSLAIVVFFFYNYVGIREVGFKKWFLHLMGEPLWLAPLMLPIHIIGELARPLSLSIRLFGNIFGEETVLAILAGMSIVLVNYFVAIPFQLPMVFFFIFTSFVQALVFTMLSTIYISIAMELHGEH